MPEYDRLTLKLLFELYECAMTEEQVNELLDNENSSRADIRISQLINDKMISVQKTGTPDGEGGFISGTVQRTFTILPYGRAVVEYVRKKRLRWWIGSGIALVSAIAAIVSVLPK